MPRPGQGSSGAARFPATRSERDAMDGPPYTSVRTTTSGTRWILLIASVLVFLVGIQLFVLTDMTDQFFAWTIQSPLTAQVWPWTLTRLTGRAIGAWLVGLGIAAVQAVRENDWMRIRPATMSYVVFGGLELVALAR